MATDSSAQTVVSDVPLPAYSGPNDASTQTNLSTQMNLGTRTSVQRLLNNQLSNRPSWQTPAVQRMYSNFTYGGNYRLNGTQGPTEPLVTPQTAESTTTIAEGATEAEAGTGLLEGIGTGPAVLASISGQAIGEGISAIPEITSTQIQQQQSLAHNSQTESQLNSQLANANAIASDAKIGAAVGGIVPIIGAPIGAAIGSAVGAATTGDVTGADLSSPEENAQI